MRKKTLLSVMTPITKRSYDFWIPKEMSVNDARLLTARMVESRERGNIIVTPETMLMLMETGETLDINETIGSLDLADGTELMLV